VFSAVVHAFVGAKESNRMSASVITVQDATRRFLPSWKTWTVVPATCLVAAALLLPWDVSVARYCRHGDYPKFIGDVLQNAEPFGHAAGVALIVLTVVALDSRARWLAPALAASALSGGIAANIAKLMVSRTRPRNFDLLDGSLWDTFGDWLPLFSRGATGQSFPSAHTATAVGLAVMLTAAYPRGRWWFASLAALVGLHRIQSSAHYPSDVCVGVALGWITGHLCLMWTERLRARMESGAVKLKTAKVRRAA